MKYASSIIKFTTLPALAAVLLFSSCNKEPEQIPGPVVTSPSGSTLAETLSANADDSLFVAMVKRAGLYASLNNKATTFTVFAADNAAMRIFVNAASGGLVPLPAPDAVFSGFINSSLPVATAAAIVSYNIVPQTVKSGAIPATFPNFQYPTIFNPAPAVSALLRLTTFPSTRNGAWVNTIPLKSVDVAAANGVIHHPAFLVTPPSRFLWDRINTDPALTYLKAAVLRADSATVKGTTPGTLQAALLNIGASLTILAPTDAAFQATLTGAIYKGLLPLITAQLTGAYVAAGMTPADAAALAATNAPPIALTQATTLASTPDVFSNPALYGVLTSQLVQGIVVYHILGSRAFTNNFPAAPSSFPTLLNGATGLAAHPGVALSATFGAPFVTAATVKGLYNATAANVIINASPLLPDPAGTSDQHYLNGVIHKIDQVLIPLPL